MTMTDRTSPYNETQRETLLPDGHYNKKTWVDKEVIYKEDLNTLEDIAYKNREAILQQNEKIDQIPTMSDVDKIDYMGKQHTTLKSASDANMEYLLRRVNTQKYEGSSITATNTYAKQISNVILKGVTKYKDIDTGEFIDSFEGGRSLELVGSRTNEILTYNKENIFMNYKKTSDSSWGGDYNCTTTLVEYKQSGCRVHVIGKNSLCYSGFVSSPLPKGTYHFKCKVRVKEIGDYYSLRIHSNPNNASSTTIGFCIDKTASTKEVEEIEHVGYFSGAPYALFYSYKKDQEVEYYDIMFTKLSDDDVTSDYKKYMYLQNNISLPSPIELNALGSNICDYVDIKNNTYFIATDRYRFTGEEKWSISASNDTSTVFVCSLPSEVKFPFSGGSYIDGYLCNLCVPTRAVNITEPFKISMGGVSPSRCCRISVGPSTSLEEFKTWLSSAKCEILFKLKEPVIINANIQDQKVYSYDGTTYYSCQSELGYPAPLLSIEVPTDLASLVSSQSNKIVELQSINKEQDEIINTSLLATDEIYMMLEPLLVNSLAVDQSNKMVNLYVAMVQRGLKDAEEVPAAYKEQVLKELEK